MALTTEQLLILNNLMYIDSKEGLPLPQVEDYEGKTIGDWINHMDFSQVHADQDYGSFITGEDWGNIIQAIQNDPTLMNMRIADTHTDTSSGGGNGRSAVFVSPETGDAVVTFKGTESPTEWVDNFNGGNTTDTPQQQNALEWYQEVYQEQGLDGYEITVTGHSKGGNKSKYITIMDDTVDHCVSFDGQGFSDQFVETYADRIADRQGIIENHNVDYDFVNLLLNDVGTTTYYEGHDYGAGGFLENHSPNTFMNFDENGNFTLHVNPNGQPEEMKALDEFLNNYLRSLPSDERQEALNMVADVINGIYALDGDASDTDIANLLLNMAADPQYSDDLSYLAAYLLRYEQEHPEFADHINHVLKEFGMEDIVKYIDAADALLNYKKETPLGTIDFNTLLTGLNLATSQISPGTLLIISGILNIYDIELSYFELCNLLNLLVTVNRDMWNIEIEDNGGDMRIESTPGQNPSGHGTSGGESCTMQVSIPALRSGVQSLQGIARQLHQLGTTVQNHASRLNHSFSGVTRMRSSLQSAKASADQLADTTAQLATVLAEIANLYERTENEITRNATGS